MKKPFLLLVCLLALLAIPQPVLAAASEPDIVIIQIHESFSKVTMSIVRGPGRAEYLEFPNGSTNRKMAAAGEGYYTVLFKLYQEGYVLQSTFTNQLGSGVPYTTLVLAKPSKP